MGFMGITGIAGSPSNQVASAAWNTVKQTLRGAQEGNVGDIARLAIGAAVATGAMTATNGAAAIAGTVAVGRLLDVFA